MMNSQTLIEARRFEEAAQERIPKADRPLFHLSTRAGWMNDPNGFSFYQGMYHLFYQYYPYDSHWGLMHWGHAVSADLLQWEYLPAAMAPDMPYDRDGCYSGSAIVMPDGRQMLMYTGVLMQPVPEGGMRGVQVQCLAFGNGVDYEKFAGNPVITEEDLPEGASRYDFRDPKIWREKDGSYRCILGSCDSGKDGQILLYESPDAVSWKLKQVLAKNNGRFGRMWECPDFFELDGKWVLLTSPQDMLPYDFEYHNGNGTVCLIGSFDPEREVFTEERDQAIDYGIDFYAPQTILTEDGRRIMIGWMQNWDTCDLNMEERIWAGQMSLPRELFIQDGRLYQKPVRELMKLRKNEVSLNGITVSGRQKLEGICGRPAELDVCVRQGPENGFRKFTIRFAENEKYHTQVSYRPQERTLKIDRKFSGSRRAIIHQRRALVREIDGCLKLHLVIDRYSVEIFINDGEQVMTATLYTDPAATGISFAVEGSAVIDVTKWSLER